MEKASVPFAISGIARPDKIRALVYANNQIAHVPLPEILKAAVQGGQTDEGSHVRFPDGTIIQFGYRDRFDADGYASVVFPVPFQDASFIPLAVPCADLQRASPGASPGTGPDAVAVDRSNISTSGFGLRLFSAAGGRVALAGCGVCWLAIGR